MRPNLDLLSGWLRIGALWLLVPGVALPAWASSGTMPPPPGGPAAAGTTVTVTAPGGSAVHAIESRAEATTPPPSSPLSRAGVAAAGGPGLGLAAGRPPETLGCSSCYRQFAACLQVAMANLASCLAQAPSPVQETLCWIKYELDLFLCAQELATCELLCRR